jgi:hypothetical protein
VRVGSEANSDEAVTFSDQQMCARMSYTVMDNAGFGVPTNSGTPSRLYFDVDSVSHLAVPGLLTRRGSGAWQPLGAP